MNYTDTIQEVCRTMITALYRKEKSDKTFKAQVTAKKDLSNYHVLYCGNTYSVSSSITLQVGDYVRVCAPCNNWNDLFVVCKTK